MSVQPEVDVLDDRYELCEVIGSGGMGLVRRAVDRRLGRDVAVKVLRPDLAAQPEVRRRFEDEARAAARLSHPAVVTVLDSGEDGDTVYLVMECLSGRTLADELAAGPLPPDRVRSFAEALLSALHAAHRLGIVHRDVKPGNVLLTDDDRPKLGDFGIAKTTEGLDLTSTGLIIGTPAYLAPERLSGEPATPASDQYALAVTLYEALTTEKPFRGETPMALAHAMHTTAPIPLASRCPGVDSQLAGAIDRAMSREPSERFASAEAMLDALRGNRPAVSNGAGADDATRQVLPASTVTIVASPVDLGGSTRSTAVPIARARGWWSGRSPIERQAAIVITAVVALLLLVMVFQRDGDDTPSVGDVPATSPSTPLPQPLDDAIDGLEDSVSR